MVKVSGIRGGVSYFWRGESLERVGGVKPRRRRKKKRRRDERGEDPDASDGKRADHPKCLRYGE